MPTHAPPLPHPPTQVLQTGQEITELDSSGFATQVPTVFAGNLGQGRYIVQVRPVLSSYNLVTELTPMAGGGATS